ncbi:hypothetical protein A9Q99_09810 [Gammaproteobacteria bacterium 45_16_T64]|nr:hypothetical protein A9Q99_09810 [Gammaproteobacteria bacterium 45_16_T64]
MKIKNLILAAMLLIPFPSYAVGTYIGKLQPYFYTDALYLIPVESQISNKPDCVKRNYLRLPNTPDSPFFDAKFSILLSAWVAKQELLVTGTGECTGEGDEIIRSIKPL